jgi:PPOX class probable F420-dependent enzyme
MAVLWKLRAGGCRHPRVPIRQSYVLWSVSPGCTVALHRRRGNTDAPRDVVDFMETSEALDFAGTRKNGVLVTQKKDGRPQLSNITYGLIDGVIKVSITADRAKYVNLVRNAFASLHVTSEDFWSYAVIDGDVELSEVATKTDAPAVDELVDYYRSVVGEHPDWDDYRRAMVADKRVMVRLTPTHVYGMLNR